MHQFLPERITNLLYELLSMLNAIHLPICTFVVSYFERRSFGRRLVPSIGFSFFSPIFHLFIQLPIKKDDLQFKKRHDSTRYTTGEAGLHSFDKSLTATFLSSSTSSLHKFVLHPKVKIKIIYSFLIPNFNDMFVQQ